MFGCFNEGGVIEPPELGYRITSYGIPVLQ